MKMLKSILVAITLGAGVLSMTTPVIAAGGKTKELKHEHWSFNGALGSYDKESVQRGFQIYREVCASCHSIDLVSFRNLGQKGGPYFMTECPEGFPDTTDCSNAIENPIVKAVAAEYQVEDGPDDSGDMFMRPGLPADRIPGPYANDKQAAAANGGAIPPDFSLLAKARHHGPDYIYSLLTGYETPPETIEVSPGNYYNVYYPGDASSLIKPEYFDAEGHATVDIPYGGAFKMAPPLSDGIVEYVDGSPETVSQYAKDVTNFMMWAAEPKLEARKKMGLIVLSYLFIFAIILYMSMRQIWSRVK